MIIDQKGFTVIELTLVTLLTAVLVSTVGFVFLAGYRVSQQGIDRLSLRAEVSHAVETAVRYLREASSIDELTESSITFTADMGDGEETYRLYLYSDSDAEPNPPYTADNFELRWARTDVGYGSGAVLAKNIAQPANPPFSQSNNVISVDFVAEKDSETIRLRTNVTPRNL